MPTYPRVSWNSALNHMRMCVCSMQLVEKVAAEALGPSKLCEFLRCLT